MIIDFNIKSLAALAPHRRGSLPFETVKPGNDFSSLAMRVLENILFQYKVVFAYIALYFWC